jgi:hypothetical protein
LTVTANESNDRNDPIRNIGDFRDCEFRRSKKGIKTSFLKELNRGGTLETSIAMVPVVEKLKVFRLSPELPIAPKPLPTEESSVIGIIEAFHHAIAPGFSDGDKNDLDPHQQAKSQDNPQRPRVSVTAMKAQFVVELEDIRYPHDPPATN